jgi:hypothetical protein
MARRVTRPAAKMRFVAITSIFYCDMRESKAAGDVVNPQILVRETACFPDLLQ